MVATLVRWSYGALARVHDDFRTVYYNKVCLAPLKEERMTVVRLRLSPMLVVIAKWSTDMTEIFITSIVLCTAMIKDK